MAVICKYAQESLSFVNVLFFGLYFHASFLFCQAKANEYLQRPKKGLKTYRSHTQEKKADIYVCVLQVWGGFCNCTKNAATINFLQLLLHG